jgi:hypothetical protein
MILLITMQSRRMTSPVTTEESDPAAVIPTESILDIGKRGRVPL